MKLMPARLLRRAASRRKAAPTLRVLDSVQIELTSHCNYRCPFCPQSRWREPGHAGAPFDREKGHMDFDLFRKVFDEAAQIAREVNFSFFGEPMMHPAFLQYMDYMADRPRELAVVMNTNLSRATREHFEKLVDIGLTELRISLDAATAETYDLVRPGGGVVDLAGRPAADRFAAIGEKAAFWFRWAEHRPTRHVFTVCSRNIHELEAYVRRWLPLLGDDDFILAKNVLSYGGKVRDPLIRDNPCNVWSRHTLTVDWTGRVSPCNLDTNMDLAIGSVRDRSLLGLHRSPERKRIERRSRARAVAPCRDCHDANNWSNNTVVRKGDRWNDDYLKKYRPR